MLTQTPPTSFQPESSPFLLWADCEFTGLDIKQGHKIIEIGAVVTDLALREIDSYQSFVKYDWDDVNGLMDKNPWWHERFIDRDRMRKGIESGKPPEQIDVELAGMVAGSFGTHKPALCGNSIGNDKKHIDDQFPLLSTNLSYQVIDVSSLKLIAAKYNDLEYAGKVHKHHALDDIAESIDEFRYLITQLGITDLAQLAIQKTL